MIDDLALLKQAMEQMDAEDPVVAHAAKDRAAQALSDARLNFAKMAELIEQRRLLLQPKIVANIKRMDQPGMLGDIAFRNTGTALRREGQSFRQIAEAIEYNGGAARGYEVPALRSDPSHPIAGDQLYYMGSDVAEPARPAEFGGLGLAAAILLWPLRRPIAFLAIALLGFFLVYAVHGFVVIGRQVSEFVESVAAVGNTAKKAVSSVIGDKLVLRQSAEAPTPPAPIPSPAAVSPSPAISPPAPAAAPASPAPAPAPAAAASAPSVNPRAASRPPSVASAAPVSTPGRKAIMRNSRVAGPCVGGVGGCYWGGGRY
jgi:hypothetical protein